MTNKEDNSKPVRTDEEIIQEAKNRIDLQGKAEIIDILGKLEEGKHKSDKNRADNVASQMEQGGEYIIYFLPWDNDRIYVKRNPNFRLNGNLIKTNNSIRVSNLWIPLLTLGLVIVAVISLVREIIKDKKQAHKLENLQTDVQLLQTMLKDQVTKDSLFEIRIKDSLKFH